MESIEQLGINTVRVLSADAVQKANSGHPGTPMGLAPIGDVLWTKVMNYNPQDPEWPNRHTYIISAGHACMLQYCFLYLTGYDVSMDDLKNFRQLHSRTAGHPEYGLLPGIEVTTGPLGQGFANGVGMAIGQQYMASRYNKPGFDIFDYKIYAICSDGDIMEGVSAEAASLAGHLKLGNLIYLYDDNKITIEGDTSITFNEDVTERFQAYGWHVQSVTDGNDVEAIHTAIINAQNETNRPSLIKVRTHIGFGSPNKVDTAAAHGSPLGKDEVRLVKENFGFDPDKSFVVSDEVLDYYRAKGSYGVKKEQDWKELYAKYKEKYPSEVAEYELFRAGNLPDGWKEKLPVFKPDPKGVATRKASGKTLNAIADQLPLLIGGSADLSPSTDTELDAFKSFSDENHGGRNFHFGIREHAMGAVLNGMALTKGIIPFGATFLIFSDYMRPPIRLAAIMKIRPVFLYTQDSIGLGED
jgi:transketolase